MSYTKGDLAHSALEEIGIAEYSFDIEPEMLESAIQKLDAMMAEWSGKGITLSFPISKKENSSPDDDSNIPDWAWKAVITNLAIEIAPSYGKTVAMETKVAAKQAYNTVYGIFSVPKRSQMGSMPMGAGYKSRRTRFTPEPENHYVERVDEELDLSGGPV